MKGSPLTRPQQKSLERQEFIFNLLKRRRWPMLAGDIAAVMNEVCYEGTIGWLHNDIYRTLKIMQRKGLVTVNNNFEWSLVKETEQ